MRERFLVIFSSSKPAPQEFFGSTEKTFATVFGVEERTFRPQSYWRKMNLDRNSVDFVRICFFSESHFQLLNENCCVLALEAENCSIWLLFTTRDIVLLTSEQKGCKILNSTLGSGFLKEIFIYAE